MLKSVYYAIFKSHLCYASLVWAENTNSGIRLHLPQKKSLRIIFFRSRNFQRGPLFKDSKILNLFDKTALENCIFISESVKKLLPPVFNRWIKFSLKSHSYNILHSYNTLTILYYTFTTLLQYYTLLQY